MVYLCWNRCPTDIWDRSFVARNAENKSQLPKDLFDLYLCILHGKWNNLVQSHHLSFKVWCAKQFREEWYNIDHGPACHLLLYIGTLPHKSCWNITLANVCDIMRNSTTTKGIFSYASLIMVSLSASETHVWVFILWHATHKKEEWGDCMLGHTKEKI